MAKKFSASAELERVTVHHVGWKDVHEWKVLGIQLKRLEWLVHL